MTAVERFVAVEFLSLVTPVCPEVYPDELLLDIKRHIATKAQDFAVHRQDRLLFIAAVGHQKRVCEANPAIASRRRPEKIHTIREIPKTFAP